MERSHQNRVTIPGHKTPLFRTPNPISTVQNEDQWVKNVLPKIISIRPWINLNQSWRSELSGWKEIQQQRGTVHGLKRQPSGAPNPISTVQIRDQWVENLSFKFQVDRTTHEAGSAVWWNLDSEEKKNQLFSSL